MPIIDAGTERRLSSRADSESDFEEIPAGWSAVLSKAALSIGQVFVL
jgi:hypothetical protein